MIAIRNERSPRSCWIEEDTCAIFCSAKAQAHSAANITLIRGNRISPGVAAVVVFSATLIFSQTATQPLNKKKLKKFPSKAEPPTMELVRKLSSTLHSQPSCEVVFLQVERFSSALRLDTIKPTR